MVTAVNVIDVLVDNVSERLARIEVLDIGRRVKKFDGNHTRMHHWLNKYYDGRERLVRDALKPLLSDAFECEFSIEDVVRECRESGCRGVDGFQLWADERQAQLASIIYAAMGDIDRSA